MPASDISRNSLQRGETRRPDHGRIDEKVGGQATLRQRGQGDAVVAHMAVVEGDQHRGYTPFFEQAARTSAARRGDAIQLPAERLRIQGVVRVLARRVRAIGQRVVHQRDDGSGSGSGRGVGKHCR